MKTDFLGWGFFSVRFEASLKKKPTPWGFSRETPVTNFKVFNYQYEFIEIIRFFCSRKITKHPNCRWFGSSATRIFSIL